MWNPQKSPRKEAKGKQKATRRAVIYSCKALCLYVLGLGGNTLVSVYHQGVSHPPQYNSYNCRFKKCTKYSKYLNFASQLHCYIYLLLLR